jgi:hypothetical protein
MYGNPLGPSYGYLLYMKRIALLLVLLAACKSSDSAAPSNPEPAPTPTDRAPRPREAPALPPSADNSAAPTAPAGERPALNADHPWRRHGDRMAKMDTDGDGKVSDEERAAALKQRAETMRTRMDANGDGKLTVDELAAGQGRMHFDNPGALDTNKDGDISADELAAGMQARRDAMKAKAADTGGGAPTP